MTSVDKNEVHQAVFGYSNGHRLLASSMQLGSVDTYELAAASDMAPGVSLDRAGSYVTGLVLPESKIYALMRTWEAPEMQRPGCVWTHVLLLSKSLISSQIDLGVLSPLFTRPADYQRENAFSAPLAVGRRERAAPPPRKLIEQVLTACYDKAFLSASMGQEADMERAILAVWSQQWPRMRSTFCFRSVQSSSLLPGQTLKFASEGKLRTSEPSSWLQLAVDDAVSDVVTPLRRFLWRYGKDIDPARRPFVVLVEIFALLEGKGTTYSHAVEVFKRLAPGQGQTLKRDLLGLSPSKLSLVKNVSPATLIRLMVEHDVSDLNVTDGEIVELMGNATDAVLPELALVLDHNEASLGSRFGMIFDAILPSLTSESLETDELSVRFVFEALKRRPVLISEEAIKRLSSDDLVALLATTGADLETYEILRALFQRSSDEISTSVVAEFPLLSLEAAVELVREERLHDEWHSVLRENSATLVTYVPEMLNGGAALDAARIMAFPVEPRNAPDIWFDVLKRYGQHLDHAAETTLITYLFVLCVRWGVEQHRQIAAQIMPELRARIVSGNLNGEDEKMLGRWLPHHSDSWDLNKRLLKLLRQEYKRGSNFDDLVALLGLTSDEYAYATNQDPENLTRQMLQMFMPWRT
ncbi:hypothetical protein [Rhizobium sp. PL01]|uniref:GAP1-N1 domain-containing protein n=1 Tax=Rhizobium sp. PL01 TaxID=3085631 RepID=UPI002982494F|nr:hypothetical protein [Rhizobium sp. PL01]MDW5312996.1 hypothetical protein [Rhizobium sp. PL01]